MTLSWNEIKDRALKFSQEWAEAANEDADAKPFLVEFFNVFGITSRRVASFEHRVKKLDDSDGYIDLLWKGTVLVEMKSRGKNLDKAYEQARAYLHGLKEHELPKYILVSDFEQFRLYDLEESRTTSFRLNELVQYVQHFGFLIGYQKKVYKEQDPANIKAAELMGALHDRLEEIGYTGHPLEVYLVRILFCLFAEDTTIFNKQQFQDFIEQRTSEDGSDLAAKLQELFQVLNTPREQRFKNLDEHLAEFPYVNGKLFEEILPTASFDRQMRQALLNCCYIDWSKISPAIFGSMFQSVMNPKERRNLGAHYTSEANILKLIGPLFLDELKAEFQSVRDNKNKLAEFHKKLSTLKFLDPACGCGNFLIITYRELRLLEFEVLKAQNKDGQRYFDIREIVWLDVDQFYGIEYEEFPARIAEVAMWLIDHQMNMLISNEFGQYYLRLPLKKAAQIHHADALETDWETVVPKTELTHIIGNPPFIGHQWRTEQQKKGMELVFGDAKRAGRLDYVAAWYLKAAKFMQHTTVVTAFVSTNSIVQGEQTSILWQLLFTNYNIKIHFAHRTFKWNNEAKGNAGVHVVIIGFASFNKTNKVLFDYNNIQGEAHQIAARNINAYLVDAPDIFILSRSNPIHQFPEMHKGSQPTDGGHLIIDSKDEFLRIEPGAEKYLKRYMGADDFINSRIRWCLWLKDIEASEIKKLPKVLERLSLVRTTRLQSPTPSVVKFADRPYLFTQDRQPESDYLVIPEVSSENRKYIPIGFETQETICANTVQIIPNASKYNFGVIQSIMHILWSRTVAGRLESRIRYTPAVYNNFPFPLHPTDKQVQAIEAAAQGVLDARAQFPNSSLADLYDPLTMPPALVKAHDALDRAVDLAYRPQPFSSEAQRMEFLFALYEQYTADLFTREKPKKGKRKRDG
jgi:type I restriction-modification system DNA methylase subunit